MRPNPRERQEVSRMSREELVAALLELNQGSTFQFTLPSVEGTTAS